MRRSLAPSQVKNKVVTANPQPEQQRKDFKNESDVVIHRVPYFDFLEIPENLTKQFTIPTGCKLTSKYFHGKLNFMILKILFSFTIGVLL